MRTEKLEIIAGNSFREAYEQADMVLTAAEILTRGITSAEIRAIPFFPGDGLTYFTHRGKPCLGHEKTSEFGFVPLTEYNLSQLERLGHYREDVEHSESETDNGNYYGIIDLSQLRLSSEGFGNPFLRVPLTGYADLNPMENKLVERIYRKEKMFHRIMGPLKQEGITETRITLLDPQKVLDTTKNGPLWVVGYLNGFYGNFQFDASNSDLKRRGNILGRRKKIR
ncbi:MAG TPA: hypothetical protein VJA23_04645 [Candidatus Nanoarchaeia archaeon]|nr:hypothetical protein [Candidatus Nanoarchaeia archaeon]